MSILQIGIQSRYLQVSPGCRKYISPFLSNQQRQQIQRQKQINQIKYRQELFQQVKQKQNQKRKMKQKQIEIDLKRQRQFYQKVKHLRPHNSNANNMPASRIIKFNNLAQSPPRPITHQFNHNSSDNYNLFKKQKQLSFPTIKSKLDQFSNNKSNIFLNKSSSVPYNRHQDIFSNFDSNYLKNHSLVEIGNRIRAQKSSSLDYHDDQEYQNKKMKYMSLSRNNPKVNHYDPRYVNNSLSTSTNRHQDLRRQLRQKQIQIYDLLQKSTQVIQSTKNPIRQMKKRLKTNPIFIQQDQNQDQDDLNFYRPRPYRMKTQFGTYNFTDYNRQQSKFYRLPPGAYSSLGTIQSENQDIDNRTMTLSRGLKNSLQSINSQKNMIRIQQNPQMQGQEPNQFLDKQYN